VSEPPGDAVSEPPGDAVSDPAERTIEVAGQRCRVWEKGDGEPVGFLGGLRGLPRWPAFLDRLAEHRRVVAPSLPGFPGGPGCDALDDLPDWVTATLDLLERSGLEGADLVGASVGATLCAEAAAFSRGIARRLALIAPLGLFEDSEPVVDLWAQRLSELPGLLSARPEVLSSFLEAPPDADAVEWQILLGRANEASARLLWPIGDRGLAKRLHRIGVPTLLVQGNEDRVLPASYAKRFATGVSGWAEIRSIEGAGHMAEIDQPDTVADAVLRFLR
jgi:pimeloyl-ACP methyl ester carboxylesterase